MENSTSRLILTLTVIGVISALVLTFVFQWTTPLINKHKAVAQEKAIFSVLPGAVEIKKHDKNGNTFFTGYDKSGSKVGIAMVTEGGGFQGVIKLMIGTDLDQGKIYGIKILEHQETPGLGARITGEEYKSNFVDKPFGSYQVIKKSSSNPLDIEAIAGATISSKKVTNIVQNAVQEIEKAFGGGE